MHSEITRHVVEPADAVTSIEVQASQSPPYRLAIEKGMPVGAERGLERTDAEPFDDG